MSKGNEIETKYLRNYIFILDELYDKKAITLGEYMQIGMQLKLLESLDRIETLLKGDKNG